MPENASDVIHAKQGPVEGSEECKQLQKNMGFACRTLLGELLCACVTCRPDVGHAVTTLAKFSAHPHEMHHKCLKGIATCLRCTQKWGMRHEMDLTSGPPSIDLANGDFSDLPHPLPPEPSQTGGRCWRS